MFLLFVLCLTGCATTLSDIVKSKEEGKGTSRIYPVNADKAWEIAKTILNWEGMGAIEERRSEGYMLKISGKTLISYGTVIGVWIEPMDKVQSKVTIITKPRMGTDSFITLTETDFHNSFDLFVQRGKIE